MPGKAASRKWVFGLLLVLLYLGTEKCQLILVIHVSAATQVRLFFFLLSQITVPIAQPQTSSLHQVYLCVSLEELRKETEDKKHVLCHMEVLTSQEEWTLHMNLHSCRLQHPSIEPWVHPGKQTHFSIVYNGTLEHCFYWI